MRPAALATYATIAASLVAIYFALRDHQGGACGCSASSPASSSSDQSWVRG